MDPATGLYEKLGVFYLGKEFDLSKRARRDDLILYDSKDLVTHAVIVGMTGSGKTGLGVGLLEEAAIDGIPALIVDPKGDLSNLLLQFPEMRPRDFEPWLHVDDARRAGVSLTEYSIDQAEKWQNGLREWHQDGERIRRLQKSVEYTIYTPGSDAGVPISILASFAAPAESVREDADLLRERIASTATSLLALLGVDADPLRSREHILLTNLLGHAWQAGDNLDLGDLIQGVQNPPFQQIGVIDLESFFPAKERFAFSMTLNNLLAAPGFAAWMRGVPLDIDALLYTADGRPRHAIFSIAHLSDAERMFFMSLLLNQTLGWMRTRQGSTSLRALLYIDEIFGYIPPVAEPPSKKPLLTLLKQARAFGLGVVLATQNPVDLDYKGLSNTGTWFIGRLQTERDKERVLDGLEGASAECGEAFERSRISEILSQVGQRVFLMHNIHEDRPVVFQTRWTLSYLTGPMTRQQIRSLMQDRLEQAKAAGELDRAEISSSRSSARGASRGARTARSDEANTESDGAPRVSTGTGRRPAVPPEIAQVFLPAAGDLSRGGSAVNYVPRLVGQAKIQYVDTRKGLSATDTELVLVKVTDNVLAVDWDHAERLEYGEEELEREPCKDADFAALPSPLLQPKNYSEWTKRLTDFLYRSRRYTLLRHPGLGETSQPGETERDFRIRLSDRAREVRDGLVNKLRQKYAAKVQSLEERVRRAEQSVEREVQEASSSKMQTVVSLGATILSAVLGRKTLSATNIGRASTTAREVGRLSKQSDDVRRAQETLESYREQLVELEEQIAEETQQIASDIDPLTVELETIELKPRKADVDVRWLALAWLPVERP